MNTLPNECRSWYSTNNYGVFTVETGPRPRPRLIPVLMELGLMIMLGSGYSDLDTEHDANFHGFCTHVIGIGLGLHIGVRQCK